MHLLSVLLYQTTPCKLLVLATFDTQAHMRD